MAELKQYVYEHMAKHKTPSYVAFVDSFPMNAAGKILKYKMREEAVKMLLRRMQDGAEGKGQKKEGFPDCGEVLLRAQIVVRGSTL